ncbi:hypothetical protein [Microbacterium sp.]|uniref:hypothetical protein n=1 Tax=Microbacterium sp. TaxID=51671 RepID=UPI0039E3D0D3
MSRRTVAVLLALGATAVLSGCAWAQGTAELTVTYAAPSGEQTQTVELTGLDCKESSINRTIVSEAVNDAGEEVFLAVAPTDGRDTHPLALWFDGQWFVSIAEFDASGDTITFDALPGSVSESPDGARPSHEGVAATLSGTIDCR